LVLPKVEESDAKLSSTALLSTAARSSLFAVNPPQSKPLPTLLRATIQAGLLLYIISMCIALPVTLLPQRLLYRIGLVDRTTKEKMAVKTTQFVARNLMRIIPFCSIQTKRVTLGKTPETPVPAVWACNHNSMFDLFALLAADKKLRGKNRRPIKVSHERALFLTF
jgi:hypothetical protein